MANHKLKTWPEPFQATWDGRKMYEIRDDDRGFAVGDQLILCEYVPDGKGGGTYSGRALCAEVTYKSEGGTWGLPPHLCVLGIRTIP